MLDRPSRVKAGVGLVGTALLVAWWADEPRGAGPGRRLFNWQLADLDNGGRVDGELMHYEDLNRDVDAYSYQEPPPVPQDMMKLFKTVAASPQVALQRMSPDGEPNLAQWTAAIREWNWGLSRSQATAMFHGVDEDSDGKVTLPELLSCFRRNQYSSQPPATLPLQEEVSHKDYDCQNGLQEWRFDWSKEKTQSCSLISASQLQQAMKPLPADQVLALADQNGDGAVDREEWNAAAGHAGGNSPFQRAIIEPQSEFAFKSMDVNRDGRLSRNELLTVLDPSAAIAPVAQPVAGEVTAKVLNKLLLAKWSTMSNAFHKMDTNGNHQITREEFGAGLQELEPPLGAPSAAYLFEGIDALRDGRITPPELFGTMQAGHLFQNPEDLRKALTWSHAKPKAHGSWIHDAAPNWHQIPAGLKETPQQKATSLLESMKGAYKSANDAFDSMDQDHSDEASELEFKNGLAHFSPPISGHEAEKAFHDLDLDLNGKVSRVEFAALETGSGKGSVDLDGMSKLLANAEDEFRKQAADWAGSMRDACRRLGVQEGLTLPAFKSQIRSFEQLLADSAAEAIFKRMDTNSNGRIEPDECVLSLDTFREKLAKVKSLRNTFVDADSNSDHKLSRKEFGEFGTAVDPKSSAGMYSIFFDDELDTDNDGFVALPTLQTIVGATDAEKKTLPEEELEPNIPANVQGKCIFSVTGESVKPGLRDKVGSAVTSWFQSKLGLKVEVVGVQENSVSAGKEFDLLYTASSANGSGVLQKFKETSGQAFSLGDDLQKVIGEAVVSGGDHSTAWCSATLDFYGPKAKDLIVKKTNFDFGGKPE